MQTALMATPISERLKLARAKRYSSPVEAAEALRMSYSTYAAHENGGRGFNRLVARYAQFFHVRTEWLLTGKGEMNRDPILEAIESLDEEGRARVLDFIEFQRAKG